MEFLEEVEQCGGMAVASLHDLLLPNSQHYREREARRASADSGPIVEALRAPEVLRWQHKYRVDWDATDGRNGGAAHTVWEVLLDKGRFKYQAGEKRARSDCVGACFGKNLWAGRPASGVGVDDTLEFLVGRFYVFHSGISSIRGVHNWKDVWRNHSRPSRRFFRGLNGVACCCALCCRMR